MEYNTGMRITPELFGAYLLCPIKCWLKPNGERGTENSYAGWVEGQNEAFRVAGIKRLHSGSAGSDVASSPGSDSFKEATWRLATDVLVQTEKLESLAHMIKGKLIHADETRIALKDRLGYVWVFASLHAVAYFYADTREGEGAGHNPPK
jgi:hypothetical protein